MTAKGIERVAETDIPAPAPAPARAAVAAAAGFIGLAGLELALAFGAPLGRAAMGGGHTVLPTGLRVVASVVAAFWPAAALVVLRRGGYRVAPIPFGVARAGTWVLVRLLGLGVVMNLASRSPWERYLQAPIAAVLAALCVGVARGAGNGVDRNEDAAAACVDAGGVRNDGPTGAKRTSFLR